MINNFFYWLYRVCNFITRKIRTAYVVKCCAYCAESPHILGRVYINCTNLKIGKNVTLYPNVYLWGDNIEIGDNVDIGIGTIIYSKNGVKISDNTIIAGQCYIIDSNHSIKKGLTIKKQPMEVAPDGIFIGKDVWIGAQCSILKGAKINNGAVIGAQSLVNKQVDYDGVAIGSPAKVRRYRD